MSLDHFAVGRAAGSDRAWSVVTLRPLESVADAFVADVDVTDERGERLATVRGVCLTRVEKAQLQKPAASSERDLYQIEWIESPLEQAPPAVADVAPWVVIGAGSLGADVASRLEQGGASVVVVGTADRFEERDGGRRFDVRRGERADWERAFGSVVGRTGRLGGVIHLVTAEAAGRSAATADAHASGAQTLLHVVQALGDVGATSTRVWVATRGAEPVRGGLAADGVRQAAALGLARSIAAEYPATACTIVDLDSTPTAADADLLCAAFASAPAEREMAWRGGTRFVPRLTPAAIAPGGAPVELAIEAPGLLERLTVRPSVRRPPEPGELEIEVLATGLNFRDVLNALGVYEGPPGPLGSECVGRVAAIGPDVSGFAVGERVLVTAPDTFRSYVTVPAVSVFRQPSNLTIEQAATIPVAFVTADYALNHLARIGPGDRVLIHAAAGGVGLAAVQLAQRAGAEIIATVGSPAKRAHLESLGVRHITSSRSLAFADEVMSLTNGEGVDVVLNSLAGDFIERSLGVVRKGGRFLELGKSGIWTPDRVAERRPDVEYHAIYLGVDEAPVTRARFPRLLANFESGALTPLPSTVFRLTEAAAAFRHMSHARHIGKIVLVHDRPVAIGVRADATYLITGAFGGLGLQVARSLVDQGARSLALVGRRPPSATAAEELRRLEAKGARVLVEAADVSKDRRRSPGS